MAIKLKEVLERAGVKEDDKARRVSNVSRKTANITADEIENGVSIEALEALNVPVLKYTTQVTIHGKLPAFSESARPGGYKSIVKNGNGSVGVRYAAIDASKKNTIVEASRASEDRKYHASMNSTGLQVAARFEEKADCIAAYKAFPRDLFAGSVVAGAGMFGDYYVIAEIGAIYSKDLWAFIDALWAIPSMARLNEIQAAKQARMDAERAESNRQLEARKAAMKAAAAEKASQMNLPKLTTVPKAGHFVRVSGNGAFVYFVQKKGPSLCYIARPYVPGAVPATVFDSKMKRLDASKLEALQKSADAGQLFSLS